MNRYEITKNEARKINGILAVLARKNPNLKGFKICNVKNDRGDYGKDSEYYYNGLCFLIVSFDGARIDTRYYKTDNTESSLQSLKESA